jgi:hypothetical protein
MGAMLAGALAAISVGINHGLDFRTKQAAAPDKAKAPEIGRSRRPGRIYPNEKSSQEFDPDRLILDRVSSVRKIQRWHRADRMKVPEAKPGTPAHDRHRERRAEAQRAKNLATLRSA